METASVPKTATSKRLILERMTRAPNVQALSAQHEFYLPLNCNVPGD